MDDGRWHAALAYAVVIYFCDKEGSQPSKVASSSTKSSRWRHHTVAKGIMQLLCCCNSCNGQQPKRRITAATMASCRHRLLVVWLDFNSAADVDGGMWFWSYCVGHNLIIFITLMLLLCAQPNSAPTSSTSSSPSATFVSTWIQAMKDDDEVDDQGDPDVKARLLWFRDNDDGDHEDDDEFARGWTQCDYLLWFRMRFGCLIEIKTGQVSRYVCS